MSLRTSSRRLLPLVVLATAFAARSTWAAPGPVLFGPATYERTSGPPDQFTDTFDVPVALNAMVWIQNGDGDGNRTSSAEVDINGAPVTVPSDFTKNLDLIAKAVALPKGTANLAVTMSGEEGSSITIVIMVQGNRPDIAVGRLLLPYASANGLTISLKNGARHARRVHILFYDDAGTVVGASDRIDLPGHGSLSKSVADLLAQGAFTAGSIEVIWAGPGVGRVFGQATVKDDLTGVQSVVEMQHAGYKRIDPLDPALKFTH